MSSTSWGIGQGNRRTFTSEPFELSGMFSGVPITSFSLNFFAKSCSIGIESSPLAPRKRYGNQVRRISTPPAILRPAIGQDYIILVQNLAVVNWSKNSFGRCRPIVRRCLSHRSHSHSRSIQWTIRWTPWHAHPSSR